MTTTVSPAPGHATDELARAIESLLITLVIFGIVLFATAGTLAWPRGWSFLVAFGIATGMASVYIWRVNRELFAVRRGIGKGTKHWDLVIVPIVLLTFTAILVIGALDAGRYQWAPQPSWVVALGYVLFAAAFVLETWAQGVNRHFEPSVRIQTDRDHRVIDTGPYAYVRHPGYLAAAVLGAGMALALGSLWALVPAGVLAIVLVVRTVLEDATLRRELPGYSDYARRVRSRWIPHVW
jgi:protein-S-isoprenylcysteine O-methyltransferase Ste14